MEKLALTISDIYSHINNQQDFVGQVELSKIQSTIKKTQESENFNLNFSNMESDEIILIFNQNEKLRTDFFKYGLYNTIDENKLNNILRKVKVPFNSLDNFIEYICDVQSLKPTPIKLVKDF